MSDVALKKENETTEAEVDQNINKDLEAAQDEVFGTDVEIAAQAAEESGAQTPEESEAQIKADEEKRAAVEKAEADKGKTEEELAAEKTEAEKKAVDDAATKKAEEDKTKTPEDLAAEKAEAEKQEEEDLYKTPEELKGRTRERFEKLTGHLKTVNETVEKQEGIIKGFRGILEKTGMDVGEVQSVLALGGLLKSNPKEALKRLTSVVATLSAQVGEVVPGTNPLDSFDDLKQRVADRELSIEDAREIASSRIRQAADLKQGEAALQQKTEQHRTAQEQQQATKDFQGQVTGGQEAVQNYLLSMEKDPDYEKVGPHLVEAAKFAAENLAPPKWLEYIKGEYTKVKNIASAMSPPGSATGTPIMDGGAPKGGEKEPKNLEQLADSML